MLKQPYHRSKKLRDLARNQPCIVSRIPWSDEAFGGPRYHDPATVVWCHSNLAEHGKGGHLKAHDCFGFLGCAGCHHEIDQGKHLLQSSRRLLQREAVDLTRRHLVEQGLIVGATPADLVYEDVWLAGWITGRIAVA